MKKAMVIFAVVLISGLQACRISKNPTEMKAVTHLTGTWVLNYISGPRIAFEGLYPEKKPEITFDLGAKKVNGNTGCNNFNGSFMAHGTTIDLKGPFAMTRMMCQGQGEPLFMETLKKVTTFEADESTLTLIMGDIAVMRFIREQ